MDHPIDKDSIGLVQKFAEKKSTRFEDFRSEWLKCKFYYMHCIRKDIYSKVAVIERIFSTMVDRIVDVDVDFFDRLGSLYLCYSLYTTQPTPDSVKIRISTKDFDIVQSFHSQLRSEKIHEGDYIFCKLKSISAFFICACQRKKCMGQQTEVVGEAGAIIGGRSQSALDKRSNVMVALRDCQKLYQSYGSLKESISDHLPLNLVAKSDVLDTFLDGERIKRVKAGAVNESEVVTESVSLGTMEESSRSKLTQREFRKAPKQIHKLQ